MEDISQKVLEKIKEEHIRPKPKWEFLLKNSAIWTVFAIALLVGSLAFAVIIYLVINDDWAIYENFNNSFLEFAVLSLPYLWIIVLGLLVLVAQYYFKHTKEGYKLRLPYVVLGVIALSIVVGTFLYNIGVGQAIDGILSEKMPFYGFMADRHMIRWNQLDKGFLGGKIIEVRDFNDFSIIDLNQNNWRVTCKDCPPIFEGMMIKMIGDRAGTNTIEARMVMPAGPRGEKWLREINGSNAPCPRQDCPFQLMK